MRHGTHMNASWHTYECVMAHIWVRHGTHMRKRHRFLFLRSIAGVPFDSVGRFRASLLLRTTCMPSSCNFIGKRRVLKGGFPYLVLNAEIMVEGWWNGEFPPCFLQASVSLYRVGSLLYPLAGLPLGHVHAYDNYSKLPQTAPSPMMIHPRYFHTSIFISRSAMNRPVGPNIKLLNYKHS